MVIAFTMLKVLKGDEDRAYQAIRNAQGIKCIYRILGECQFFIKLEAEDGTGLQSLIDSIMNVADVTQTGHMLVSSRDALDCLDPIPA